MREEKMTSDSLNATEADAPVENEENFAALLDKSGGRSERLKPGQKVKSKVVSISGDLVYIDLGGKSEGTIGLSEFASEDGTIHVQEGDEVEAFFLSVQDGVRRLTMRVNGYSAVKLSAICDAHSAGLPVKGEVRREVKGGFEILMGGVRCFCPFSQIDLKGGHEGGIYLGRTFPFKVLEYEEDGRNIIVSRRALLEEEKKARVEKLSQTLQVGTDVSGRVSSLQRFGAFVDLGGIDGLIPLSEISWSRTEKPEDALTVGQEVTVRIISLDWHKNRLGLSMKAMQQDPWNLASEKYRVGSRINGTIVRLAPFGAFVNLEPGIDGLVHISNLGAGRRINHPREVVEAGQIVEAYVLTVDIKNRKISLSLQEPKIEPERIALPSRGELLEGQVEKIMPFGVFLKLDSGAIGLVPNAEMGTPAGADHARMFPQGTRMQVVVLEADASQNRVRLSRKRVMEKVEQEEFHHCKDSVRTTESSSGGFGSLGELLKAKMEEKRLAGRS